MNLKYWLKQNRESNSIHADWLYPLFVTEKIARSTVNIYSTTNTDTQEARPPHPNLTYKKIFDVQKRFRASNNEPANMIDFVQMFAQSAHNLLLATNMDPRKDRETMVFYEHALYLWYQVHNAYPNRRLNKNFNGVYKDDIAANCNLRVLFGNQFQEFFETPEQRFYYLNTLMAPGIGFDGCVSVLTKDKNLKKDFDKYTSQELEDIVKNKGPIKINQFQIKFSASSKVNRLTQFTHLVKECTNNLFKAPVWHYVDTAPSSSIGIDISFRGMSDLNKKVGILRVLADLYSLSVLKADSLELMWGSFRYNRLGNGGSKAHDDEIKQYRSKIAIDLRRHKESVREGGYTKEYYDRLFQALIPRNEVFPFERKGINLPGQFSCVWILRNHFACFMGTEGSYHLSFHNRKASATGSCLLDYEKRTKFEMAQHNLAYNHSASSILQDIFGIDCNFRETAIYIQGSKDNQIRFLIDICSCDIQRRDQAITLLIAAHQSHHISVVEEYKEWCFQKWKAIDNEERSKYLMNRGFTEDQIKDIFDYEYIWADDDDHKHSFTFLFDDEYVVKFLKVVTQLPVFLHYVQVCMTKS